MPPSVWVMAEDNVQSLVLGDVEVLRIVEWQGPFAPAGQLVPDCAPEVW